MDNNKIKQELFNKIKFNYINIPNKDIFKIIDDIPQNKFKPLTITEMQKTSESLANFTCQKISALLRQLIEENKVAKEIIKKKSYFSIV